MEEKKYPVFEEEEFVGVACEPVANATAVLEHEYEDSSDDDWIDDLDRNRFPSLGRFSEKETIARIDKFEDDLANEWVKWISSEEAWKHLYNKYLWLSKANIGMSQNTVLELLRLKV